MPRWVGCLLALERESGLCLHDAVVVIHPVVDAQGTARLTLRILDQLYVGGTVRDGGEIPRQIAAKDSADRG